MAPRNPENVFATHDNKKRKRPSQSLIIAISILLLLLLILIARTLNDQKDQEYLSDKGHVWQDCGSSPAEAKQRGCKFDILSFAWQTKECYDGDLMSEFINSGPWQFYEGPNSTSSRVTLEVANRGERDMFVNWGYHVWHCTFMWRQMHRAFVVRGYIDSHLDDYAHTLHCQQVLLDRWTTLDTVNVMAALKYPRCRPLEAGKPFQ